MAAEPKDPHPRCRDSDDLSAKEVLVMVSTLFGNTLFSDAMEVNYLKSDI